MTYTTGKVWDARFLDPSIKFHTKLVNGQWKYILEVHGKPLELPDFDHQIHLSDEFEGNTQEVGSAVRFQLLAGDASNVALFHLGSKKYSFPRARIERNIDREIEKSSL